MTRTHRLALKLPLIWPLMGALLGAQATWAADMTLEVQGITANDGQILVAVFAEAKDWLRRPVLVARADAAEQINGMLQIQLHDLPDGLLALNITHDLNNNGRLDMNAMGLPIEPYGFSNNAVGMFGPPSFEKAAFTVTQGARIAVQLN